jgi:DNA (cytosine-5)-methyltransferase 1
MNVIDLFAGAGGLSLGFRQEKFKVLLSTDIDIDCKESYLLNWPKSQYLCGDIREISPKILESHLGGPKYY